MKQIVQNNKTGELKLVEVPAPLVRPGGLLVRNVNSAVSLGTERLMIDFAKKNLLSKALARRDLTKQVVDLARTEGFLEAYSQAMNRLDAPTPLGYSSAGVVLEVGEGIEEFKAGDRVACAGSGFASHAEVVFMPRNLCVKIPKNVEFESAAFVALGAIALHSVHIADLRLGENIAIIGLGLLGQFAAQIAKASGCGVLGVDIGNEKVSLAQRLGIDKALVIKESDVVAEAKNFTRGRGVDAVIILANARSSEPLELASEISRERGRIIAPGMVKLDVPREIFYQKELRLTVSKSFGPGSYDPFYELKGMDYPYPYVRWTMRRNMEHFLELVAIGKVNVSPLITHRFSLEEAETAYKTITEDTTRKHIGVLICCGEQRQQGDIITKVQLRRKEIGESKEKVNVGLIGAGLFARGTILPVLKKIPYAELRGIATASGASGKHVGGKFGFDYCTTDYLRILEDEAINCVIIATRHNLHAKIVSEALKAGKHVFVEKPLALSADELEEVITTYGERSGKLMVGFNRRFSPFSVKAKEWLHKNREPIAINCRVNAGDVPEGSWVRDPIEGGGRILGEVCHFVDLVQFFTESFPIKVYAQSLSGGRHSDNENIIVTLTFLNGSVATITYVASGDKAFSRERLEIIGSGSVCVIDNFKSLLFSKGGKRKKMRRLNVDRGHLAEFSTFLSTVQSGEEMPVDFEEYVSTTITTFAIEQSLSLGIPVDVKLHDLKNWSCIR